MASRYCCAGINLFPGTPPDDPGPEIFALHDRGTPPIDNADAIRDLACCRDIRSVERVDA
ncbi:hypothetical protein [Streptomyces cadmiisoli]|uniref:hypothetical protein n=1 Tax=Streptomyces cadmiisoli TaxID=2184053 RepID=UPI003660EEFC